MPHRFGLTVTAAALAAIVAAALPAAAQDQPLTVEMLALTADGSGERLGTVTILPGDGGTSFQVRVSGTKEGEHGFHVHENPSCAPADGTPGGAAGGHWDPRSTGTHQGPEGGGHLGDLPFLTADAEGLIDDTVTAPRITDMNDLRGRALIIHEGGDTYSDEPRLGGGAGRVACGVIPGG